MLTALQMTLFLRGALTLGEQSWPAATGNQTRVSVFTTFSRAVSRCKSGTVCMALLSMLIGVVHDYFTLCRLTDFADV